uniref:Uncharacterized protein n=1 Tax=Candidatus Kentrum sp. TUN TaxID=2126343 RepID=A0A450ZNB5_9GAMM|nr:MAG: hypothetical protein BECKTUN1418F_GA0071002_10424 [Candidatus Kentron sp. TUN]VFK55274.1 MAG: hypothetical protein BECKTUN1418D_GA0071000_10307 [Candidatus Kentron sp. TUN]VFK56640.1 MAG: hypothetical protein BECKTUN1418E_GA0071001_10424 [Candidatus Kentron sp. TUN]
MPAIAGIQSILILINPFLLLALFGVNLFISRLVLQMSQILRALY